MARTRIKRKIKRRKTRKYMRKNRKNSRRRVMRGGGDKRYYVKIYYNYTIDSDVSIYNNEYVIYSNLLTENQRIKDKYFSWRNLYGEKYNEKVGIIHKIANSDKYNTLNIFNDSIKNLLDGAYIDVKDIANEIDFNLNSIFPAEYRINTEIILGEGKNFNVKFNLKYNSTQLSDPIVYEIFNEDINIIQKLNISQFKFSHILLNHLNRELVEDIITENIDNKIIDDINDETIYKINDELNSALEDKLLYNGAMRLSIDKTLLP